ILVQHPQQKPYLLLTDAGRMPAAPYIARRQAITQPAVGRAQHLDLSRAQAGFFLQLAVHRLVGCLVGVHAALRELPAVALHPPRPEHLAARIQQHDAHIQAVAVHVAHGPIQAQPENAKQVRAVIEPGRAATPPARLSICWLARGATAGYKRRIKFFGQAWLRRSSITGWTNIARCRLRVSSGSNAACGRSAPW